MTLTLAHAERAIFLGCDPIPLSAGTLTICPESPAQLSQWLKQNVSSHNTRVALVADRRHPDVESYLALCRSHEMHARTTQFTLEQKWTDLGRQYIENLPRLSQVGWTSQLGRPLEGATVFVVGAGPSLEKNRHLMRDAAAKGYVFAVNTSAGATDGAPLDAVFCAESLDVITGLAKRAGETLHVLELGAHPANWAVPAATQLVTSTMDPMLLPYSLLAGGVPIPYSCGVTSMAASQAVRWGAKRVVLVGQDLAWGDGNCYASGSPFEDMQGDRDAQGVSRFSGSSKIINDEASFEVPAWGGGTTLTTSMWAGFIGNWGIAGASLARDGIELVDATEGGASIPNATERRLSTVLDALPRLPHKERLTANARGFIGTPRRALERILSEAQAICDAGDSGEMAAAATRCPILTLWVYPEVSRMVSEGGFTSVQMGHAIADFRRQAGDRVAGLALDALGRC